MNARLNGEHLRLGYDKRVVIEDLDVSIPDGELTVIIGPNACGKSTLLKALARAVPATAGSVTLDGRDITSYPTKEVARRLGLLPQSASIPEAITVADLVGRGRFPHQRFLRQWTTADQEAVDAAMRDTQVDELAQRPVDELSGGQRQRAWLAMVLAQQTPLLLLDEPTTFLDIAHQLEVLDLCADLQERGLTIVAVLHDLNQACRYASHLICMAAGRIVAAGPPADIVTADLVQDVFGVRCEIILDPQTGTPLVVPLPRASRR
ncbi:ABC transporter ATP-binding protein [Nakamurella alba]|nr:ABC transporter ATP-binding protein [Nakamurella alba]